MQNFHTHFPFVRFCINSNQRTPSVKDWDALFMFMKEQALLGVGFNGLEKLSETGMKVPREVLLKWFAMNEQIIRRNGTMNQKCVELTEIMKQAGLKCCILKGQGNALMYPEPELRTSGDIDVWVDGTREEVMAFVKKKFPTAYLRYHHVDFPIFDEVPVELHFIPCSMNNPDI